ncbi:hydantoinase/oxoprolinase family protein [Cytobacillus firmus]|uniref:N-methylhydantoinase A n=1 Tax=Cytobacillus firmus TaxID=1399 RepID=A0A800MUD9_CYTFI|nr:hydantoinase/oxoprolinase family protein [Cytobacillus firmus]KAF0822689.1 N-methylhydantoinase A [Cytobacillus firmus]MDD9311855.1 hydantoinase/oxoprolinase family protein [Cytobacillus firmus]
MTQYQIGIDIGGTFTDLVLYDKQEGSYRTEKILTTPKNLADGVLEGMQNLVDDLKDIDYFVHGTTAGLNAFLERKGSNVALIVTKGFRDVYEIGRANRPDMYSIKYRKPEPLVKRRNIFEIEERVLSDGSVETPINLKQLDEVIEKIIEKGFNSVSLSLLHAYKNPEHEEVIKNVMKKKAPQISVSLSHEIAREWREYERTSTTVINGYIAPIVESYLSSLEERTESAGLEGDLYIMQSNGGVMTSGVAKRMPIQTLLSGPVGGAVGSITLGNLTDYKNLICVDMGGTSFDVSLIIDGEPDVTSETSLEGFPILTPMVNIHTIGAGGGSIAWIEGGGLRVGPKSAGSDPGPACYGNGGTQATVTDANLVLGRLDEDGFLDGKMKLNRDAAYKAIKDIADRLNLGILETAEGICDIANAKMADAIRTLTVSKGIDPRDFALVAFGGAGPMHAVLIAELLGITKILVPTVAGTFSAWGMLQTDIRHDAVRTFVSALNSEDRRKMDVLYEEMELETKTILTQQRVKEENMILQRTLDLRYVGQEYTVNVPLQDTNESGSLIHIIDLFHEMHGKIYGHSNPDGMVEAVNIRITGYGKLEKEDKEQKHSISKAAEDITVRTKKHVTWNGVIKNTPVIKSELLKHGHCFYGPSIIENPSTTTVIPEGYRVEVDRLGNLEITREGK